MASQVFINKVPKTKLIVLLSIAVLLILLLTYAGCQQDKQNVVYQNHAPDVDYVGMKACVSCHRDKHSTFIHTGMGLSFDSAVHNKSSARFGIHHQVYDSFANLFYYPFWREKELYVKEYRLINGDTVHQLTKKIDYIVGSGQHTNSHLIRENGYIYQAPITFYVQKQKWDLAPGFENGNNSRFQRILNVECISCHNAMPQMHQGSEFKFEQIGNGIDCERCHGPGQLHVNERLKNKGVDTKHEIDPTIVNPRKLSWERQIDLCQRCHLQGLNVLKEGKSFTDFRPGMRLSDVFEIYLPKYKGNHSSFDMANHSQRFQMSKCFTVSNKNELNFTCISCHNPHISVTMTGTEVYNAACKKCHTQGKCTAPHTELDQAENNCVTCHMPQSGSEDIPHVSVHDHYIRKPSQGAENDELPILEGLYAVNNASPELKTQVQAYLEYWEKFDKNPFYIDKAKELLPKTKDANLWLKYHYLKKEYAQATQLNLDESQLSAWQLFMLGEAYAQQKQKITAVYYLEKAYAIDPTSLTIGYRLLKYYIQNANADKATHLLRILRTEFPQNGHILNSSAKLAILQNRLKEAKQDLDLAIRLLPDDIEVWLGYLNYYAATKNKKNFIFWAEKIKIYNPRYIENIDVAELASSMK